ncbi:GAF domain-containing sensor histidine kinase [Mycolicibacterium lacusdiani]|uniref:GAF domain-containing sensor histidine kinase n=1 Tax=Mycolicibacterium lacusdiani TaxID=2895283 RepID=UPI0035570430
MVQEIHQQLDELQGARVQTEKLLHVIMGISSDLDLDATLDRIAKAAIELTGARYGALGVRDSGGALSSFLHQGIDPELVRSIGPLPVGKGVLGVPLEDAPALRLDDLAHHPAAAGFPPHHPPMHAFLGVPITIRGEVYGSLYVTHAEPGQKFSESDEVSVRVLASAAAVAIDNARLFERVRAAGTWTQASREISTALLSGAKGSENPLRLIAERARDLTGAEQAIVLVPEEDPDDGAQTLVVSAAIGLHAEDVVGRRVPVDSSTSGGVFLTGLPIITESFLHPIQSFTDVGQRPAIVMPLSADDSVIGVIVVARRQDDTPFDPSYLDLVSDFARHAALALTLASARARERELTVLNDRERIAHDLHDHVIQRLFAAGLDLQGTIARSKAPEVNERLSRTLDDLQSTIETIRTTIFELQSPAASADLRVRLRALVSDLVGDSGISTTVRVVGPVGGLTGHIAENAEAVATEAISNAVRHSNASHVSVTVTVRDEFTLEVADDGGGIPEDNPRRSGLANMQRRAELLGGDCTVDSGPDTGTLVRWSVPVLAD